jgi:uncharacterized protein YihD (DUF1040 family)
LSQARSQEELNREIIKTLQKIVSPEKLSRIYDKVISYQKTKRDVRHQEEMLGIIKEYMQEIDIHLRE